MKSILVLMMAILLATATAVSAQTPPQSSSPQYTPPTPAYSVKELESLEAAQQQASDCPFAQALQEANVAWQRLRAMCVARMAGSEGACIEAKACKGAGCASAVAGCAKGALEPKSCCCAKACACCETCKTAQTVQAQCPMTCANPPVLRAMPSCPLCPTVGCQTQSGSFGVQIVAPTPAAPVGMVPHVVYMSANVAAKPAKLVTPDFEAHCDQMIQEGNTIQLNGNVMLLCKKYAQPLRVEGQRIVINLNDSSFVVETGPVLPRASAAVPAVGYGIMRMSINETTTVRPVTTYAQPCTPAYECPRCVTPGTTVIELAPAPTAPRPR